MSDDVLGSLKKLCDEYESQLAGIRNRMNEVEYIPLAKSLVGQCFKYPSSSSYSGFGFGTTTARVRSTKRGYVYKRIIGADKEYVIVDTFEVEGSGKIEISFNIKEYVTHFTNSRMIPITEKQYFVAFKKLVKYIFETGKKEK
jgi:hypothetical protein